MALDTSWMVCSKCGKKPPEVLSFHLKDPVVCCVCEPPPKEVEETHAESYERGVKEGSRTERERILRLILTLTAGGFSEGHDAQHTLKTLEENIRQSGEE